MKIETRVLVMSLPPLTGVEILFKMSNIDGCGLFVAPAGSFTTMTAVQPLPSSFEDSPFATTLPGAGGFDPPPLILGGMTFAFGSSLDDSGLPWTKVEPAGG